MERCHEKKENNDHINDVVEGLPLLELLPNSYRNILAGEKSTESCYKTKILLTSHETARMRSIEKNSGH